MKRFVSTAIKVCVTAGLFVLLFWPEFFGLRPDLFGGVKPADVVREVREAQAQHVVFWLTFALVVRLSGMLCGVLRWRILLRGQGLQMPFWYMVQSWFVGRTIGIFLPGTIGLDGYRLYDSSRYTGEVIKCTTVIAVEKLIGFIALTGLVFLTLPFGLGIPHLRINPGVLAGILAVLGAVVAAFFLLLLNPRVIQVLVAVLPTPAVVRGKLDKLGAAATAYSGNRGALLLAVFYGLMVHLAACIMYFGTMMAIRASNTSLFDILFASPLMIYGTVIGPSIGGEGIREIVFVTLLGGKSGAATAVTFAHLGWWVGDVVPFLVGLPILALRKRPSRAQLTSALASAQQQAAGAPAKDYLHLGAETVARYRAAIFGSAAAGLIAGLIAGAIVGLGESFWLHRMLGGLTEPSCFTWGPLVYGVLFAALGLGIAGALIFLFLLLDRFAPWPATFALCLGGTLGAGGLVIGLWRVQRDIVSRLPVDARAGLAPYVQTAIVAALAALIAAVAAFVVARAARGAAGRRSPVALIAMGIAAYLLLVAGGAAFGRINAPAATRPEFAPRSDVSGPNIILVAIDALRADVLRTYEPNARAETPALNAFIRDSVLYPHSFSQASWTKPAFATIFTGLHPEAHGATGKASVLPRGIETLAGLLAEGGYYAKGLSNNPNTTAVFGFDQGFTDYTDLKPRLYFFAGPSAARLSMYEVLRKGRQRIAQRLSFLPGIGGLNIYDFYQPAEAVTREALAWIDSGAAPAGAPFYLYLHYMDTHDPFMQHDQPGVGYARSVLRENVDPALEAPMREAYDSEVEYLDRHLGALFQGLKDRGLYDDALIVFTSDHGEEFYDHEGWWHGYTLYEEMLHVPLIIKLPGNQHAGLRQEGIARHVDLAPTMLHFAGLPKGEKMEGISLFGPDNAPANHVTAFSFAHNDFEGNLLRAVRALDAKLIHAEAVRTRDLAPVELYDILKDPGERVNLAEDPAQADRRAALEGVLEQHRQGLPIAERDTTLEAPMSRDLEDQLRSLGYLE